MRIQRPSSLVLITLLLFSAFVANAQKKASISGTIIDSENDEALPGANVYFKGTSIGGITDVEGNYLISGIPEGEYVFTVSYIGYETHTEIIKISSGDLFNKDIKLGFSGGVNLEDVVVTAQAQGQFKAINQQLRSDDIKNVVSSERIRELPDANAAESLGRLPGVSVQRDGGEGAKVVVRGLSPKYSKITLDGVEMASTGETFRSSSSTAGGTFNSLTSGQEDRSVNLNMISSYSLEGIEVIKAHTAENDADFIGGTVNFKMRTAPEGFNSELIMLTGYNGLSNTLSDYNINAILSNRFFGQKLGVFAQGNVERRNRSAHEISMNDVFINPAIDPETGEHTFLEHNILNMFMSDIHRERIRRGGAIVLDYKLRDGFFALKNNLSSSKDVSDIYDLFGNVASDGKQTTIRTRFLEETRLTYSSILQYEQRLSNFELDGSLSYSYAETTAPDEYAMEATDYFQITSGRLDSPDAILDDIMQNATNTGEYFLLNVTKNSNENYQRQREGSFNAKWFFTLSEKISGSIKAGVMYRHKEKAHDYEYFDQYMGNDRQQDSLVKILSDYFPESDSVRGPYGDGWIKFKPFLDNNYTPSPNFLNKYGEFPRGASKDMVVSTYDAIAQAFPLSMQKVFHNTYKRHGPNSEKFDYRGEEDYSAAYLMGNFQLTSKVVLIPGVRFEHNRTSYTAKRGSTSASGESYVVYRDIASSEEARDTTTLRTNQYFLPSVHLKYNPTDWLQLRMAYTNTLARPSFTQLVPRLDILDGQQVSFNTYYLQPEESTNFDFVATVHNNLVGLFSANLFTKRIDNKIVGANRVIGDYYEIMNLDETFSPQKAYLMYNDTENTVVINGIEIEWQTNFWYLPGVLKGIVLNINYTHILSRATYLHAEYADSASGPFDDPAPYTIDRSYTSRLIDQPSDILNVALGFDYKGFSGRISLYYQSDVFTDNSFWSFYRGYQPTYHRYDLSLKQKLPVKGLQVFLNLNNINRAMDKKYKQGYPEYPARIEYYGMTIDIGLKWNFNKV